jgi:hypothetical protein
MLPVGYGTPRTAKGRDLFGELLLLAGLRPWDDGRNSTHSGQSLLDYSGRLQEDRRRDIDPQSLRRSHIDD